MSFGVSIGDILKLCEIATRVYKNCRDCPGEYKTLANEARNLTNLLEDIKDKFDAIPPSKRQQLLDVYEPCVELLQELDKILIHYNGLDSKSKRAWDRLKWDEERSRTLREKLTSSVVMLNTFYTSLVHDNQVLILQALGRLERDYRGGHREESVASVQKIASGAYAEEDDEDDDAAWPQIIRDLEDVGISPQHVLDYRDFIVDWFVRAVNSGRLMERSTEPQTLVTLPQDLQNALPESPNDITRGVSSDEVHQTQSSQVSQRSPSPTSDTSKPSLSASMLNTPATKIYLDTQWDPRNQPSKPLPNDPPRSLNDHGSLTDSDLTWIADRIVTAWENRDFTTAETLLEQQLAAIERGEVITVQGRTGQPDRRVLLHLLGVCASYSGKFIKAKGLFEKAFNGIYLSGGSIDEGDIAAARWLGDVCLHLNEPHNTAFAWAVALEGLVARNGTAHNVTWRVYEEMYLLDYMLQSLRTVIHSFRRNYDPTDIFPNTHATEKASLIASVQSRMEKIPSYASALDHTPEGRATLSHQLKPRPRANSNVTEACLLEPLVSLRAWPLQWDATFSPRDAIILQQSMSLRRQDSGLTPSNDSFVTNPPTIGLVHATSLDYVTKRDMKWLLQVVEDGLNEMGFEYRHSKDCTLICRLNQRIDNYAFFEGIGIKFRKLQLRSMYGIKVTSVLWATRTVPTRRNGLQKPELHSETEGFRDLIKSFLKRAEDEERLAEPLKARSSWKSTKSRSSPRLP